MGRGSSGGASARSGGGAGSVDSGSGGGGGLPDATANSSANPATLKQLDKNRQHAFNRIDNARPGTPEHKAALEAHSRASEARQREITGGRLFNARETHNDSVRSVIALKQHALAQFERRASTLKNPETRAKYRIAAGKTKHDIANLFDSLK
jgi:hypothetical protein